MGKKKYLTYEEMIKNQGIQIEPKDKHKFKNESEKIVQFLVVTIPKIAGDRVDVE